MLHRMGIAPDTGENVGTQGFAGEADVLRGGTSQTDALSPAAAGRRLQRTLRALADVDAGRLIDDEAMQAWADSLGTDRELPIPQPG
jgi:hypothetical protein